VDRLDDLTGQLMTRPSAQIDKKTLLRLGQTYGWLSDFGAFLRDF
jgi:hypothetical protein